MRLAPEGLPQMLLSTAVLLAGAATVATWFWPAAIPLVIVWGWSIAFFRDPLREASFGPGILCAPADGVVQDITPVDQHGAPHRPAVRIGIFLSLFDVHINRSPCTGRVRSVDYLPGKFFPAMKPEAATLNESNTLVLDPSASMPGPVVVRQIAGLAARRIVCHAQPGTELAIGERFGLIKYGSRTELIVPKLPGTQVMVKVGDKVRAGLTPLVWQTTVTAEELDHAPDRQDAPRLAGSPA